MAHENPPVDDQAHNEEAEPLANQIVAHVVKYLADQPSIAALIRGFSPLVKKGFIFMPSAVAHVLHKKEIKFLSPEWAETFRRVIVGGFEEVAEIVNEKGSATNEEIKQAFVKAETAVMETKLLIDPMHHVHMPNCGVVQIFKKPAVQPRPNPKFPNEPPPPPPPQMPEITIKDAMSQGLKASPCCLNQMQEAIGKATAAPKSAKKNRSPLEIIGSIKDEGQRKSFRDWLSGLSPEDRERAFNGLRELDSEEELSGLLDYVRENPKFVLEMLPLLENRNAMHAVQKYLTMASDHLKKWNDSLAPEVERLKRKYHDADGSTIKYEAPSFWQSVKKLLTFDLF